MKREQEEIIDFNDLTDSWDTIEKEIADMKKPADKPDVVNKSKKKKRKDSKKNSVMKEILSWVFTFSLAILVAIVLKEFVIINATVPTGSMENTIMPGDDLFGFRLAYNFSEPERGDIIIFKFPDDRTQKYVKRIIGLPGETIVVDQAKIFVDGVQLDEPYLKEEWLNATGPFEFKVPEDSYLVLGDNRNDSLDARFWTNTYVPKEDIIGKAMFVYFPFDRFGTIE